jgi:hypothetical protein
MVRGAYTWRVMQLVKSTLSLDQMEKVLIRPRRRSLRRSSIEAFWEPKGLRDMRRRLRGVS